MTARCTPVIIIGAARSGTKMLRDAVCGLEPFTTWPCDEINYIWRHGNVRVPHDELRREDARPRNRNYIRGKFKRIASNYQYVVEKTCANSLRVGFVDEILPEARFIVIVRDGRDVAASARRKWTAPLELRYLARKSRFVPVTDLPYYAARYALNRLHLLTSPEKRLSMWGPRPRDFDSILAERSLLEACAVQWRCSVDRTEEQLPEIDPNRVHRISYEEFVENPVSNLAEIATFLAYNPGCDELLAATSFVTNKHRRKAQRDLTQRELRSIEPILAAAQERYRYG